MKKLVYIGFAFKHHEKTHAGYHHIREYVNYDYIINVQWYHNACTINTNKTIVYKAFLTITKRVLCFVLRYIYILRCIILGIIHDNLVFHFIYGENIYVDFSSYIRKGNQIVCTLHQPVNWFRNPVWEERLRRMDKIILLSKVELSDFEKITGRRNVYYVPHGISTDFYKMDYSVKKEHFLLTVGNWLRDYEFANKVYKELLKKDKNLNIVIVANTQSFKKIDNNSRITLLQGITDEELLHLYQTCSVLFLPLTRFTANNALLEASAVGCNIVIASDYSDNCYIPTEYIIQTTMSIDDAVDAIENNYDEHFNSKLSQYVQENYSWSLVGQQVSRILEN